MKLRTYVQLARASNLPTVVSNVLCGIALGAAHPRGASTLRIVLAMCLLYSAGMFLNDAFDRDFDRVHRPERPIPGGAIAPAEVFLAGGLLLASGVALLSFGVHGALVGVLLAAAIVVYDAWHKENRVAPLVMAACRALVYLAAAASAGGVLRAPLVAGAAVLFVHVAALTWWAKLGGARVGLLIAGISLVDALLIACTGRLGAAAVAVACFFLTCRLQRAVPGT